MNTFRPAADTMAELEAAARDLDRGRAVGLAVSALKAGARHPLVWSLVAEGLEAQGRAGEAAGLLQRTVEAAPFDAPAWLRLGRVLLSLDRRAEARAALERGLDLAPDDYRGRIDGGMACLRLGDLIAARLHFEHAARIAPDTAEPLSALAVVAGLDGDAGRAREMGLRALERAPTLVGAQIAVARADRVDGALEAAVDRLTRLLRRGDLTDPQTVDAHDLRAECFDALDRPTDAYADYAARNATLRRLHGPPADGEEGQRSGVRRLATWFDAAPRAAWTASAGPDSLGARTTPQHVFLVGFPRSGTTLLEKALAGHPDIVTLEEVDVLGAVGGRWLASDAALTDLARLTPAQADAPRQAYWRGVGEALNGPIGGRIFIDKLPLHTPALPLIAKLFPDARILFALRDPRDVVFSCFRRRFRINAAMFEFLTLDGAARYYADTMRLAALYRDRLKLAVHDVRHEAVVADFDGEVGRALGFIGAAWDPAVHDFPALARTSSRTPSAPQVARGLNADGVGQWRRYRDQLAPVATVLAPWVERFGYDPN